MEIAILGATLLLALAAFASQRFRVQMVAMSVLVVLTLTGVVSVPEALSGFSNPAVITVGAVLVVSGGLVRTGVAGTLGRGILRLAGSGKARITSLPATEEKVLQAIGEAGSSK